MQNVIDTIAIAIAIAIAKDSYDILLNKIVNHF